MSENQNIVGDIGLAIHSDKTRPGGSAKGTPKNKVRLIYASADRYTHGSYYLDPNLQCKAQHALYEPVTNRFIFCSANHKLLQQILVMFSSRYPMLRVIRLDKADNFRENLIDNTCITGWTYDQVTGIPNAEDWKSVIYSAEMAILSGIPIPAKTLVEVDPKEVEDELYVLDMPYMQMVYGILEDINAGLANNPIGMHTNLADINLSFYVNARAVPFESNRENMTSIYTLYNFLMGVTNIVYTEKDHMTARTKILELREEMS